MGDLAADRLAGNRIALLIRLNHVVADRIAALPCSRHSRTGGTVQKHRRSLRVNPEVIDA